MSTPTPLILTRLDVQRLEQLIDSLPETTPGIEALQAELDRAETIVGPEDQLHWARDGVQESQMRKLKLGQISFEGSLDLHGMTVEKARETLWEFLGEAVRLEVRCVRVTHGKAVRLDGKRPMIKSHVNTWLRQHSQVLGFCSCQAKHGGAGAVYVMLKRTMMEGRDE